MTNDQEAKSLTDEQLLAIAGAATPGPWYQSGSPWFRTGGFVLAGSPDPHVAVVLADLNDTWETQRSDNALDADHERDPDDDAAFIATFDPPQVRALILRAQAAEARVQALLADHARLQNEVSGALPGPVTIDREGSRDEASVGTTAALATEEGVPVGYSALPDGVRCRCYKLWRGASGRHYCCKPRVFPQATRRPDGGEAVHSQAEGGEA